jgi:hypothetical protein
MIERGADLSEAQRVLGYSSIATTGRFLMPSEDELREGSDAQKYNRGRRVRRRLKQKRASCCGKVPSAPEFIPMFMRKEHAANLLCTRVHALPLIAVLQNGPLKMKHQLD